MNRHILLSSMFLLGTVLAPAQVSPLSVRVQVSGTVQTLADNGTIQFSAEAIGRPVDATVSVTNRGTGTIYITRLDFTGSVDYTVTGVPAPETAFAPNDAFVMTVRFQPTTGLKSLGSLRFFYTDTPPTPPGGKVVSGSLGLNLSGVAPDFAFTYVPPPTANATPLLPGGTIAFPATNVNETGTAAVVITNRGSGPGNVGVISSTGAAFSLSALPNPPATVEAGRDLRFAVRYTPTVIESSTGGLTIEFVDKTVKFNLAGSSSGAVYSYELIRDSSSSALPAGSTISIPDVAIGEKSFVTVRIKNTGNADGKITTIGVQGTGFTLTDGPFLPAVLTPGSATSVAVTFTPTTPGRFTGRLRIGDDSFDILSNGLGANLTYSYLAGPVSTTIVNGGSISFPSVAAGSTASVRFVITNTGTSPAPVNSIGVLGTGTTFAASSVALPAAVQPGESLAFSLTFAPVITGTSSGTLRVDGQSFTLTGLGNPPPAIPEYRFSGASGAQQAGQQVAVGLSLTQAYSLTLRGTLTLTFNSDVFANDPAVQFAAGGRTVSFTIPAGQRDAVFAANATQVRLQTGSVAGSIVLTPSFQSDGGIALTPTDPPALALTVASAAPRILSLQLTGKTTSGWQVLVTGFATSRQISTIDLTFTPVSGENLSTTKLTVQAEASLTAWYQSTTSAQYGSQFTATIPLTFQGDVINASTLADTIRSISATMTNRIGTSPAVSVDLQ